MTNQTKTTDVLAYRGPMPSNCVNAAEHSKAYCGRTNDMGSALAAMLVGWEAYAKAHADSFDSKIGDDGVMGNAWAEAGLAMKRLLDGELGGFDGSSLAQNITEIIEENGLETDGYSIG